MILWIGIATLAAVSVAIALHAWRHRAGPSLPALDEKEVAEHGRPLATHVEVSRRVNGNRES